MKKLLLLLFMPLSLYSMTTPESPVTSETEKEDVVIEIPEFTPFAYLRAINTNFAEALNNHLNNMVKEVIQSPQEEKKGAVKLLSKVFKDEAVDDETTRNWRDLQRMIVDATQDVYVEQNKQIELIKQEQIKQLDAMRKEMDRRWSKKKAAAVSGFCTLASTAITAAITYFTTRR